MPDRVQVLTSDSSDNAHEDKRQQVNDPKATRAARRKSGDGKAKPADKAGKAEQSNKAQRRKEQNRAAQKAFRERREAKVRDVSISALISTVPDSFSLRPRLPNSRPSLSERRSRTRTCEVS